MHQATDPVKIHLDRAACAHTPLIASSTPAEPVPHAWERSRGGRRDSLGRGVRCTLCRCPAAACLESRDRRPPHRPVRQDPAARGRPPGRARGAGRDRAVRRAGALPRARAHLPADPARAVERPGRRPRRRAGRRRAGPLLPLRGAARAAGRRRRHDGPLRPAPAGQAPRARPGPGQPGPRGAGRGRPAEEDRPDARRPDRRRHRRGAPVRARPAQAGAAQGRLAGRGPGRVRRRRGPPDRAGPERLAPARLPAGGGRQLLGRRLRRRRAALRGRQDPGRRGRDGPGDGDHADPGHQHRRRPAVEARAAGPHVADRGGDRRVLAASARRSARSPSRRTR